MFRWQRIDSSIYRALVFGRFHPVIRHLRRLTLVDPALAATLRRDLHVQALIWCAHDIQMVVARLAISAGTFGSIVKTTQLKISPDGIGNKLLERRAVLEAILDLLYGSSDWRQRDLPLPSLVGISSDAITRDPIVKGLERRIELLARDKGVSIDAVAAAFAEKLGPIALRLRENDPELAVSSTSAGDQKRPHSLSAFWYSGLPDVAAATVPILRFIQAEQQMSLLIDELVPVRGNRPEARAGTALPPYDETEFPHGWRARVSNLLSRYRVLLNDPHQDACSAAWPAIDAARRFLKGREQRLIGDDEADPRNPSRTLYLLDVLPEHRFAAGV